LYRPPRRWASRWRRSRPRRWLTRSTALWCVHAWLPSGASAISFSLPPPRLCPLRVACSGAPFQLVTLYYSVFSTNSALFFANLSRVCYLQVKDYPYFNQLLRILATRCVFVLLCFLNLARSVPACSESAVIATNTVRALLSRRNWLISWLCWSGMQMHGASRLLLVRSELLLCTSLASPHFCAPMSGLTFCGPWPTGLPLLSSALSTSQRTYTC
jgi:hypothetical protein